MKTLLVRALKNFIGTVIRPEIETIEDESGFYIRLKLYLLDDKIWSGRIYLKRVRGTHQIKNQKIKL